MRRLLLAILFFISASSLRAQVTAWVAPSLTRVGQTDAPGTTSSITVSSARGEIISTQVIVRGSLTNVNVSASVLNGPSGATIPASNITLYREYYVTVTGSGSYGGGSNAPLGSGTYPEPLIPFNDPETSSALCGTAATLKACNAIVGAGQNQPYWIDIFVPRGSGNSPPGTYTGTISVTSDQGTVTVPVTLIVWNFELPLQPTEQSLWTLFSPSSGNTVSTLTKALMRNRIMSWYDASANAASDITNFGLNRSGLDATYFIGIQCNGTFSNIPTSGQITTAAAAFPGGLPLSFYVADEVTGCTSAYTPLKNMGTNAHAATPRVSTIATFNAPDSNLFNEGDGQSAIDHWTLLASAQQWPSLPFTSGGDLWSYASCNTGSGNTPEWMVDYPPINERIQAGFLNWTQGAKGVLYFHSDGWTSGNAIGSWNNLNVTACGVSRSGDGIFIYPPAPISSTESAPGIRLKAIRDGIQDYEYAQILNTSGQTAFVNSTLSPIATSWTNWTKNPGLYLAARTQLAQQISQPGIYFAQNSAGLNNGTDCADAYAYNDVTHGINIAANWVPGNTLHVCGTISVGSATNVITAKASGSNGLPITIKFESTGLLQSPFFPGDPVNGCSSNCGAIDTNNFNFITIDGGGTGIIQNTANGSSLANQGRTIGVDLRGHDLMLKGLKIRNMYLVTSNEGNLTCTGPGLCPGAYSADVIMNGSGNMEVCNNDLANAHVGVQSSAVSSTLIGAPDSLCTNTQAASGVNIYNNFVHDHGWQVNIGGNGYVNIFNNDITDWAAWFNPTGTNAYHLDGVIVFGGSANSIPKPQIYNNYIHGDFTNDSPTGFIFCTYGGANDGSGSQCTAYNNLIVGTGLTATSAFGIFIRNCETAAPFGCGPHFLYNNTIIGFNTGSVYLPFDPNVHTTIKNNIIISGGGFYINTVSGPNPGTVTSDNNVFFGGRFFPGPPPVGGFPANQTLSQWQTASGNDTHSVEANPNLDSTFHIQSTSSPAYQRGANLSSVGLLPLNTGSNSTFGINAVNNGTARPVTPPTVPWDAGVYPFVSGSLPVIGMSPSPVNFANQNVGSTSGATTITVSNTGTANQVLSTPYFTITGTNSTNFANAGTGTCTNGGTIAPSGSCTVNITFTPSAIGARTATLTIQGTVFDADTLNGTGIAPVIAIAPSPVAFGNQRVATTSAPLTVTISNTGTGTETLANPFFTVTGTNSADFARTGGTCANSGTIAASASCTIILTFTPAATGARTANLNILGTVNALASITGTGIQAALTITPSPGAFGNVNVGTPSSPLTVTVTNSGSATETLSTPYFTLTGTNASDFSNAGTGTCANAGTIAVNGSCTVNLTFTPAASGARAATLTIQGTVNGTDSLTGTGVASAVALSPTSIAFANQTTGTSSGNSAVVLTNTGTATLSISSIVLSGANAAEFSTNGSTCGANLAASGSCTLNVVFSPVSVGSKSASLVFNTGAASSPDSVSLSGTGVAPAVPVLSLSPNPILFGNQLQNTTSAPITVTVSNTGSAPEVLATPFFTLTGTNGADFARSGGTCVNGGSIAVSGSCTVTLTFTPTATGSRSGILNILGTVNASDAISGIGILPVIGMSPSPAAFGNQLQGTTSGPLTVTVSNTGSATEVLATPFFTITGTNASNFVNAGGGTCVNGGSIAASSSCTILLTFTPSATGSRTATLTIQGTVNATDSLTGTGTLPVIGLAPSPAAFGNQNLNITSSPLTVTVSNTGTATETLSTPFFTITGTNAANFARSGGTCANAGTIAASASCTILLTFTPSATGPRSASLNILGTVNATDSLTGTGIASAVSLVPTSIAFGNQTTGTTSGNTAVTLTNTGTATLNITSITLTGANAGEFSTNGSTCGSTLAPAASCGLNVAFSPVSTGAKTASLTFTTDAASSPNNIPLTGTGTAVAVPALSFSPSPLAFGNQVQGTTSFTLTLTVTNTGTASEVLATPYFTITGTNPSSFANSGTGTCVNGGTIIASGSCTILLSFTPSTTGALAATLNVLGTVNGSNAMTGTGTPVSPSGVTLSPTSIAYGNQDDGSSSPPTQVSLTNTGTGTLTITSIALTGANATEFSINTNTCGASLAVSASCTWNVVFSPATAGSKSASVTVTTNAATSPDAVTLTGTGRVPTPRTTPAPAITIVNVFPVGSVLISDNSSGIKPRNVLVSSAGCSEDGVTYSNPCLFLITCGNCGASTKVRWNGTLVSQTFANGVITASVPVSLIPQPSEATKYQFSLLN